MYYFLIKTLYHPSLTRSSWFILESKTTLALLHPVDDRYNFGQSIFDKPSTGLSVKTTGFQASTCTATESLPLNSVHFHSFLCGFVVFQMI